MRHRFGSISRGARGWGCLLLMGAVVSFLVYHQTAGGERHLDAHEAVQAR